MVRIPIIVVLLMMTGCHSPRSGITSITRGTTTARDGVSIAYDTRGQGSTALVFIHGWACDRTFWREQVDVFAKDYRVVTLDLPAHGDSGNNRKNWSINGLGEDVATLVKHLGLRRIILIGHSMGGPVALDAARRLPGRVLGMVCVDTLHNVEFQFPASMAEKLAERYEKDFDGAMTQMVSGLFLETSDPQIVDWVLQRAYTVDHQAAIALLRDFANLDLRKMMSTMRVPVRGINAAQINNKGMKTEFEINRKYADYDTVLMDDVSHYLMLDEPIEFNKHLRKILTEFTTN